MPREPEDFTEAERRGLDAWQAPPLPDGLVDAAVDRALTGAAPREVRRRDRRFGAIALGVAAAAVLVVALLPRGTGDRRHLTIAGTVLACEDCELGVTAIEGGDDMKTTTAGLTGAAAGAALTAAVLVSVYSGKVEATAPSGATVEAGPGDAIVVREGRDPVVRRAGGPPPAGPRAEQGDRPRSEDPPDSLPAERPPRDGAAADPPTLVTCREEAASATARAERAEGRVRELEGRMKTLQKEADRTRTYDLSQEQLLEMASRCELRWDMQPVTLDEPQTVTRSAVEELGLSDAQVAAANAVLARTNQRLLDALMGLYVEATGDTAPAGLAPDAMFAEILDKTPRATVKQVFQRLSAERAGLAQPPADTAALDPAERLFRLVTAAGDRLERELGEAIGPELARALRDEHRGWGEKSASRMGCPGEDDE